VHKTHQTSAGLDFDCHWQLTQGALNGQNSLVIVCGRPTHPDEVHVRKCANFLQGQIAEEMIMIASYCMHIRLRQKLDNPIRARPTVDQVANNEQPVMSAIKGDRTHALLDEVIGTMHIADHEVTAMFVERQASDDLGGFNHAGAPRDARDPNRLHLLMELQ